MPSSLLQKLLAELRASRAQATEHERRHIESAMADLLDGILANGDEPGVSASEQDAPPQQLHADRPMSKLSPFYGIGLKEACPKLLFLVGEKQGKRPLTPREIWELLKAEGWTSNHNNPAHSVNDALRRRAQTHRDVMLVGAGKWGRTDWYTDTELEEIRKSMGGMGGRDRGDHIERTKAGMATAKLRGARLGAVNKLSPEATADLLEMARSGSTVAKIAEKHKISTASVNNYLKRMGHSMRSLRREGKQIRTEAVDDPPTETEPGETRH